MASQALQPAERPSNACEGGCQRPRVCQGHIIDVGGPIGFPFSARADGEERMLFGVGRIKIPEIFPKRYGNNHFAPHKAEQIGRREKRGYPSISGSGSFNQDSMKWSHIRTLIDGGKCKSRIVSHNEAR
uniref:Uncharacterized protein n=1 Tax=Candidatus Kentrum sp. FM TaxID=2126340 RepID=A0A450T912_9GAMM|nr:MAG: hypothetical protein BECKFM1743A_GA0114220_103265 [Candidatus Kentron sp. FM]VFK12483.1 MAG: hypothetical protein BECKFM1743B_GA0114221_102453 [Candidatus Kentron sp. FM]